MNKTIFIATILLSSPCSAQQVIDASAASLPADSVAAVIDIMSHDAANPIAVQFRNIQRSSDALFPNIYCGEINLPNRVGGYDGFSKFVVNIENKRIYVASQDFKGYDNVSYVASCQPKD